MIDQANRQIEAGEYEQAYEQVFQYKDDQRAAGTIGVSLMMQKKFEDAMPWLQKAAEDGCQASQKNIETIQAEYQYEEQQRKEIAEYLKKFE